MKTAETLLACCVVGLACFIGGQSVGVQAAAARNEASGAIADRDLRTSQGLRIAVDSGTIAPRAARHGEEVLVASSRFMRPERPSISADEMRRRLASHIDGTYMRAMRRSRAGPTGPPGPCVSSSATVKTSRDGKRSICRWCAMRSRPGYRPVFRCDSRS